MFNKKVMKAYEAEGMDYIKSGPFQEEFHISVQQFKYNTMYLYGLLQSTTKRGLILSKYTTGMTKMIYLFG